MKEKKYHLYLDEAEHRLIVLCLVDFRNKLIAEGRYTNSRAIVNKKIIYA